MEVLLAFFGRQVAGDAAAGERHQQVKIHGIDLDDSIGSGGQEALAVGVEATLLTPALRAARVITSRPLAVSHVLTAQMLL